jgi:hypothetical protein
MKRKINLPTLEIKHVSIPTITPFHPKILNPFLSFVFVVIANPNAYLGTIQRLVLS